MEAGFETDRLRLLLDRFGDVADPREPEKVKYPLNEVLFPVSCATIAGCDDYDEIAAWGHHHLGFLRRYAEYFFGIPKEDWLRVILNRIDPRLFEACFMAWARSLRPDAAAIVALDGKTLRRSGDTATGAEPLHLVSAWASTQRLVLCQEAVEAKENECTAILTILERLPLKGALVTIDAIATNPTIAEAITAAGGDYVLALKRNQPTLHDEVATYFDDPRTTGLQRLEITDKDHGRIETGSYRIGHDVDWPSGEKHCPGEPRFHALKCLVKTTTRTEWRGTVTEETRYFISSAVLTPQRAAEAIRGHWGIESMHWVLDVVFNDDQSRLRKGHGARNMAVVRHFAIDLVRKAEEPARPRSGLRRATKKPAAPKATSIKLRRKLAGWDTDYLDAILAAKIC